MILQLLVSFGTVHKLIWDYLL